MRNFNSKNFLELLEYTKKNFFKTLGTRSSKKLEKKFKDYYLSKIIKKKINIKFDKNKEIIFPFKKMGLKNTADLFVDVLKYTRSELLYVPFDAPSP